MAGSTHLRSNSKEIVMPVIAPLEMDEIDTESRARIDAGLATGMYSKTLPLQVMARAPAALRAVDEGYKAMFRRSLLDKRFRELLLLRWQHINHISTDGNTGRKGK